MHTYSSLKCVALFADLKCLLHCQLERLTELEDTVAEQENTIAALNEKLRQKEEEIIRLRAEMATSQKHIKTEKQM